MSDPQLEYELRKEQIPDTILSVARKTLKVVKVVQWLSFATFLVSVITLIVMAHG